RRALVQGATGAAASLALGPALGASAGQATPGATVPWPPGQGSAVHGPRAERLTFSAFNVDQAPLNIANGDMDLYLFGLKTAAARDLEVQPNSGVRLINAPATTLSLLLNPAPAPEGQLNPFAIPAVRQAMQYLVDRDFIANTIFQGRAVPMRTHVSPFDYDELTVFETVVTRNIRFDPDFARGIITTEMQATGATLENNVWTFNGQPIILKLMIRVEDERRDVGDTIRNQLTSLGFQAQPIYQQFGPATLAVYASDPITFQWHIYTEGWSQGTAVRYDSGAVNGFIAPWTGNMPGWQEVGFWQYVQEEADRLGQRLFRGEFADQSERDELYRQLTGIGIDESVRIWLVNALQAFPVRVEVDGLNEGLGSGPRYQMALREAAVEGRDEVRVGNLWVWTDRSVWNPVGGYSDVYSGDIARNLSDGVLVTHPFTGLPMPFRGDFAVETAGAGNTLPVPERAVLWDAAGDAWRPVGGGKAATSKVTFDFGLQFQSTFHHGQQITMADVLYGIAQSYELAYDPEKVQIETAIGVTSRPYLETFVGFDVVDERTLDVYVNYWHFESSYIASYAAIGGATTPWEVLAAMDDVVFAKRQGGYSSTAATRFSVPWLSLVIESDSRLVLRSLQQFIREQSVPAGVFEINDQNLVTAEDAQARYEAAIAWFDQNGLLVIQNGAYQLTRFDPGAQFAELTAFRDEGYPFTVGQWLFGPPPVLAIQAQPPASVTLGAPVEVPVTVEGPGTLALQYWLVDPTQGTVVAQGTSEGAVGAFTVAVGADVTATLFPGLYQLWLLAASDQMATVTEQRLDLNIGI
ncbi:MAG: hypothetical protein H0W06_07370, partial [Chloroflexia bacterium]|nr:hypothetical protein [Chloroflexia bacterium]